MKKNNNSMSQHSIKRAEKNKSRSVRKHDKLESHINFLYRLSKSYPIDIEKIANYTRYSNYFKTDLNLTRSRKEVQYIMNKLISMQEANK